jgi:ribonuclease T1
MARQSQLPRTRSQWAAAILVALIALGWWWLQNRPAEPADGGPVTSGASHSSSSHSGTDRASGLRWVTVAELPDEAGQTLRLIDSDGPFPYDRDGVVFGNFEGVLPDHQRGYYHEYTVPTPGESDRGARRIVTGGPGEYYWTGDHYASFERIAR